MLEILSETKDPTRVQPHLKKCFEAVDTLTFTEALTITHLTSCEGESVPLVEPVDTVRARGSVERWLLEVESAMFTAIHASTEAGMVDYAATPRTEWVLKWPGMVVLAVAAVYWTEGVANALGEAAGGDVGAVRAYEKFCTYVPFHIAALFAFRNLYTHHVVHKYRHSASLCRESLLKIVDLVRGQLTKLQRATLGALVVMDVHARDVVTALADNNIINESDFDWQAQLRSYWVEDRMGERGHTLMMHMMSAELEFGCDNSSYLEMILTPIVRNTRLSGCVAWVATAACPPVSAARRLCLIN